MSVAAPERTLPRTPRPLSSTQRRDDPAVDAELVRRAQAGDAAAFTAIVERHRRGVTEVARLRLGTQGDPADVAQETFTAAWRRIGSLRDPERLRPWLMQIARRTAIDHGRRHRRHPVELGDDLLAPVADNSPEPDEVAELTDLARRVTEAVDGLSPRDATAITLAAQMGFGPAEIAAALDVTPGNAKVILHRARKRLRAALAEAA